MIITGTAIGSIAFGVQGWNAWHNRKNAEKLQELQELYEIEVQKKMSELAKEQFEKICRAKLEIADEEYKAQLELLKDLHQENLRSIEYLSSLDKWPLAVMPLVMRDDKLFFNTQEVEANKDQNNNIPISVIIGPCRDKAFQNTIWCKVEEHLAQFFCTYYGTMSDHPIIFYQDAWRNEKDPADGGSFADIHAKIKNVPTIIISPIITKNSSLQLEISHWCIKGLDTEESYVNAIRFSFPEESFFYEREANYDNEDIPSLVNELCNDIESLIGIMSDQYMWLRYHEAPLLPTIVQNGLITCNESERDDLYSFYLDMLTMSFKSGDVIAMTDIDNILRYCGAIDIPSQRNDGFLYVVKQITQLPQSNEIGLQLNNLIEYQSSLVLSIYNYCQKNQQFYHIDDCTPIYQKYLYLLCVEGIEAWCLKNGENKYPWTKAGCRDKAEEISLNYCKRYVHTFQGKLKSALYSSAKLYSHIGISLEFAQEIYYKDIKSFIQEDITKSKIDYELSIYQIECLRKAINDVLNHLNQPRETMDFLKQSLEQNLQNRFVTSKEFSSRFIGDTSVVYKACNTLSRKSVGYWCEKNLFSKNRLRSSISPSEQSDIDNFILTTLKKTIASDICLYIGEYKGLSTVIDSDETDMWGPPSSWSSIYSG